MITNEDVQYTLKDVLGKTIQTGIFQAKEGNNRFTLNGSELVAGHYFITLEMGSISIEKKDFMYKEQIRVNRQGILQKYSSILSKKKFLYN